ncbi:class E sortase [Streptomyces sp. NPDC090127]|uniref:class E sortase n=1 Tax=Streptomyces sp. NPDC090127 TaxID=3365953 RepID=UPI00381B0BD3
MRDRVRDRVRGGVPVVVQTRGVRSTPARLLWGAAEAVVTCGVVLLLLVVHQLWWTNQQARAQAGEQVRVLEREWEGSPDQVVDPASSSPPPSPSLVPTSPTASEGPASRPTGPAAAGPSTGGHAGGSSLAYAIIRIPRIGLTAPIARGVGKRSVLDRGYVGHYPNTGGPGQTGNFALAGHRNTHGEPFRHINRLTKGDRIRVQTRDASYEYVVDRVLAQTSPRDTGVIQPVPRSLVKPSYGYSQPGAYLTLTTCTPEFSSTYRLIVWAKRV